MGSHVEVMSHSILLRISWRWTRQLVFAFFASREAIHIAVPVGKSTFILFYFLFIYLFFFSSCFVTRGYAFYLQGASEGLDRAWLQQQLQTEGCMLTK